MMRKSISQAYNRKLSVATFVDDDEDDDQEEFMEESMSLATPGLFPSTRLTRSQRLACLDVLKPPCFLVSPRFDL
jgi:hypothetical protein